MLDGTADQAHVEGVQVAMSPEHKEALARGRAESRAIKAYLGTLEGRRHGRSLNRTTLLKRLERTEIKLAAEGDPLKKLVLMQQHNDIQVSLESIGAASDPDLAEGFVTHAKSYSERKGIKYATWRQYGVPAEVLRKAGVS